MKSAKLQTNPRSKHQKSQKLKKAHKLSKRVISTHISPSTSTSSPIQFASTSNMLTLVNSQTSKRTPLTKQSRLMSGCKTGGCGSDDSPASLLPQEAADEQASEQQQKTMDKMRKQQRDFSLRLYRGILRQHRYLPPQMRILGDPYVQEEFRLHKNAKPEHLQPFYEQWIEYLGHLRQNFEKPLKIGRYIEDDLFYSLNDEQKEKLIHMHHETQNLFGLDGTLDPGTNAAPAELHSPGAIENPVKTIIQTTSVHSQPKDQL